MKSAKWSAEYASDIMKAFQNGIFPYVGIRPISEIKSLELFNVLCRIEKRETLERMRKMRQRCSVFFCYAIATRRAKFNPAADLSSALGLHQSNHFPLLEADKIPCFLRTLDSYTRLIATKLLMITGVRTIEFCTALWSEFDLDNVIWEIPAERMKIHRSHLVPLSSRALDLLNELKIMTGNYRYVFPGWNDPSKPISEGAINQLTKRLEYCGKLTAHRFRYMMSTILYDAGFNSQYIELQLTHIGSNKIRSTYNHTTFIEGKRKRSNFFSSKLFLRKM